MEGEGASFELSIFSKKKKGGGGGVSDFFHSKQLSIAFHDFFKLIIFEKKSIVEIKFFYW